VENQIIFPWIKSFEIGYAEIDNQHKKLVDLLNNFYRESYSAGLDSDLDVKPEVKSLINELLDYTHYHFEYEEKVYERYFNKSKLLKKHQNTHKKLGLVATKFKKNYELVAGNFDYEDFISTLVLWLADHILTEDAFMFSVIFNLDDGLSFDKSVKLATEEMKSTKREIAETISAMIKMSSGISMHLRREIMFRLKVENNLVREISTREKAEKKLTYISQHDALTDLPNRYLFRELGKLALSYAKRNKFEQALLFIDIDGFKAVNDTLGHDAGDELLIAIAKRLKECVRDSDIIARIGGDEFTIHLGGNTDSTSASAIAGRINLSLSRPFKLDKSTADVGASIGISIYPDDAEDLESLVKTADSAMYEVKKSDKNSYKLFSEC